ncbi:MAG: gliding motility-associated ABC transporter ATP-binding subunit GldA [Cyclobacteriaceae bacterium]
MSVEVNNLSKIYGAQRAVDAISFTANKGQITGFLGPNGAGKSTTMKIATGYIPPTEGSVRVAGLDVVEHDIATRKKIGYLPEHNPLYLDMYVHEYLRFVGKANGMGGSQLKSRILEIIELCGLTREQNKMIGSLSKGYRQRVGLAQALIHDPEVLILDEPTTGLDPNQILEIRKLIRHISKDKTVIFSTHIMQEVQALCDRVVIINKGKIVKDASLKELQQDMDGKQLVMVEFSEAIDQAVLEDIPGVLSVSEKENFVYELETEGGKDVRNELLAVASAKNIPLVGLRQESASLEDMFYQLTVN